MAEETSTITLKKSTKERLESLKGARDWNTFLEDLYLQKRKKEGMNSLAKLRELLDDKDLDKIQASSRKFKKEFKLG
jgi:hypothetical protein